MSFTALTGLLGTRISSKRSKKANKKLSQKKEERLNEVRHKRQEIEERKQEIYKERRKAAQSLRIKRMKNDQKKYEFLNEVRMQNAAKKELIKTQEKQASIHLENLKRRHIMEVQVCFDHFYNIFVCECCSSKTFH